MIVSRTVASVVVLIGIVAGSALAVNIETVRVGNPGNAGELSGGYGPARICGAVNYVYNIGKYEVTAGQYTEFLNAVAVADSYGLYNPLMDTANEAHGCNIKRSGSPGNYTYSVPCDWANRPVNYVSWGDAARFANWLHNGQPTGAQSLSTTEDGAYYLNGATSDAALLAVNRESDWKWAITSEDEWYKAAYYDPNKPGGAGYWDYPTRSNALPSNMLDPSGTNNANYYNGGYTIGDPYYRTEVGAFASSSSPYGTFDQGGNVWEWNESVLHGTCRGTRGGSFEYDVGADDLNALNRNENVPTYEHYILGFRVAMVPEPATMLLAFAGAGLLLRRRHCGI